MNLDNIKVRSHVGRDFIQTASLFNTLPKVVCEFVLNGLQFRDPADKRIPQVSVRINSRKKTIEVADNGHGMNPERIQQFLTLHGEQLETEFDYELKRSEFGSGKTGFVISKEPLPYFLFVKSSGNSITDIIYRFSD